VCTDLCAERGVAGRSSPFMSLSNPVIIERSKNVCECANSYAYFMRDRHNSRKIYVITELCKSQMSFAYNFAYEFAHSSFIVRNLR